MTGATNDIGADDADNVHDDGGGVDDDGIEDDDYYFGAEQERGRR